MATPTIIAENQTGADITLVNSGSLVIPGSGSVILTDYLRTSEIQDEMDIRYYVENDDLLLNVGGSTLSKAESLSVLSVIDHDISHTNAAYDELDGDIVNIDWVPSVYTANTSPTQVTGPDELTAHLAGIDYYLGVNAPGPSSDNYVFSYDTTVQNIVAEDTWQALTFSNNDQINGWTHVAGTNAFTCGFTGRYACTIEFNVEKAGSGSPASAIRALIDGVELVGSHNGMDITSNNTAFSLSRTFLINIAAAQVLTTEFSAQTTNVFVTPAPIAAAVVTPISGTIIIRRLT